MQGDTSFSGNFFPKSFLWTQQKAEEREELCNLIFMCRSLYLHGSRETFRILDEFLF